MLRGLWRLTWIEIKIFVREPLGLIGTVALPVVMFIVINRIFARRTGPVPPNVPAFLAIDLPVFAAILMTASAVLSLVTVIAIYREGGILKRLRATPLKPHTILAAHVLVKLFFTATTLALLALAGRRYQFAVGVPFLSFMLALLFSTLCIMSLGFLIASIVPTARFAQPLATVVFYPMLAVSGLFVQIEALPAWMQAIAPFVPLTYAVSLLKGVWAGEPWSTHLGDVGALVLTFAILTGISSRVFRWE